MRPSDAYQGIDEILQADVMRFMAIIAFCLIAILALVRTAEPVQPAAVARAIPETSPMLALRTPAALPSVAPEPEPRTASAARPAPSAEPVEAAPPRIDVTGTDVPEADVPQTAVAEAAEAPEPGLSLRFASDRDFLRLLNRGDIQVFAFRDGEVLAVGQDLHVQPVPAPGPLHELLPETIPDLMAAALRRARPAAGYRWGVSLPERVAREIRAQLDRGANGVLVIDRFGEVRLHDA